MGMQKPWREKPDLAKLGAFIRAERRARGLSQTELAERGEWTQARISRLERGNYFLPTLPTLVALARALAVSLADLITAVGFELGSQSAHHTSTGVAAEDRSTANHTVKAG